MQARVEKVTYFAILTFPVVVASVKVFSNLLLLLLAFIGIYYIFAKKYNPFTIAQLKLFSWIMIWYFGVMFLSIVLSDMPESSYSHLGRKAQYLIAPFAGLAFWQTTISLQKIQNSLKIGVMAIGVVVLSQYFLGYGRPSGMFNANILGDLVAVMTFLSILGATIESKRAFLWSSISLFLGFVVVVLSASRGSWISFVVLLVIFTFFILRYVPALERGRKFILLASLIAGLMFSWSTGVMQNRIKVANVEVSQWAKSGKDTTSTAIRLEMWRAGIKAFGESPIVGNGYRNANIVASRYVPKNIEVRVSHYTHLHNEYITTLAGTGIMGILALFALVFLPLYIFVKSLSVASRREYAMMGVVLCSAYATFGFTHIAFGEENINAFYVFFLAFLLPRVMSSEARGVLDE